MITLVVVSLLMGWLFGGFGNWAADHLPYAPSATLAPPWVDPLRYWWRPAPHTTERSGDRAAPRPWRTPLLLIATALCFAYTSYRLMALMPSGDLTWQVGQVARLILAWVYVAFFLAVLVIDLEHRRVLNIMLLPAAVVALGGSLLPGTPALTGALLGGALGFGLFLLVYIIGRGRMGAGDVKFAGVIGLMVGYPAVWTALGIGVILGGVGALVLLASRNAGLRSTMAYAPYLALGAIVALWQTWGIAGLL